MGDRSEPEETSAQDAIAGLRGTGRYLSPLELKAWTRFLDSSRLMEQLLERHLINDHNMSHSEYEILVRLDGAEGAMRLAVLADQCVSSRSRLTHTLNRVESRGWIRRDRVAGDGRGFNAVLTPEGSEALAVAAQGHAQLVRDYLLTPLTDEELPVVADVFDRISRQLRSDQSPN